MTVVKFFHILTRLPSQSYYEVGTIIKETEAHLVSSRAVIRM